MWIYIHVFSKRESSPYLAGTVLSDAAVNRTGTPPCGPCDPAGGFAVVCRGAAGELAVVCRGALTCTPASQLCSVFSDLGNGSSAVFLIVGSLLSLFYQDEEIEVQRSN